MINNKIEKVVKLCPHETIAMMAYYHEDNLEKLIYTDRLLKILNITENELLFFINIIELNCKKIRIIVIENLSSETFKIIFQELNILTKETNGIIFIKIEKDLEKLILLIDKYKLKYLHFDFFNFLDLFSVN